MNKSAPQPPAAPRTIGKIVKSNTHIDYVCQVFGRRETPQLPQPEEYALGSFVAIALEEGTWAGGRLVGVIYNTLLINPDFGNLGPRLSPLPDLKIVSPDLFDETAILVGIIAVGWQTPSGQWRQGIPEVAALVNNAVQRLNEPEVAALHTDAQGRVCMRYAPILLAQNNPIVQPLLVQIADRLLIHFPAQARQLTVMRNNLAWKSIVQPAG
jgi:hypothetical protein